MTQIRKWADEHQFEAAPMNAYEDEKGNIIPKVRLLWMTPDPLGAVAAMCRMYEGKPTYDLAEIDDDERRRYFTQVQKTHLRAPMEAIQFHFFIEGVTRSFTHQMVRIRTGCYAQESMRFAVKEHMASEISLPPSIADLAPNHPTRQKWDEAVEHMSDTYNFLIANGIPAEDARGLAPHAVTTRLNWIIDLRNMAEHAGNRLCTQAQFEWRIVFMGIVDAIRNYTPDFSWIPFDRYPYDGVKRQSMDEAWFHEAWEARNRWQFEFIADSGLFRPICYQLGRCMFQADFDRSCSIRSRVDTFADMGITSDHWGDQSYMDHCGEVAINPAEWMLDPAAARKTSGGAGHD